ncbi:MAG: sugar phosphate isomerase/epimerase [Paenibacillaceae bacterium]|nr:sugar phosphate isomerase/epimerase [Paenibacillaceae bacterium]
MEEHELPHRTEGTEMAGWWPGAEEWLPGMSYSAAWPQPLAELAQAGIRRLELTWHPLELEEPAVMVRCDRIVAEAEQLGMKLWSVHIPYGEAWDPSRGDEAHTAQLLARASGIFAHARRWGAEVAVFHPSWEPIAAEERGSRLQTARDTLARMAEAAAGWGIVLAVECLPRTCLGNTAAEIEYLLSGHPALRVCCDVNHLLQEAPEQFIRRIGSRIATVHLSDNDGADERHWMPGEGVIRWPEVMRALAAADYRGPLLHEVRIRPPEQVAASWRQLLAGYAGVEGADQVSLAGSVGPVGSGRESCPIAVTDQASGAILVFDPQAADWNDDSAILWSWRPEAANGFPAGGAGWGLPTDAKWRRNDVYGGEWMVICDSNGLAALVSYPAGQRKWSRQVGGNPHAAELLPDGNVAVAASHGGWVRVYAARRGADADVCAAYPLEGAHGVLWDPSRELLWAIGDDELIALRMIGTPFAPAVEKAEGYGGPLPSFGGHDLYPVFGDDRLLWVTTEAGAYQFDKASGTFAQPAAYDDALKRRFVKSIGSQPADGRLIETVPDAEKRPQGDCTLYPWCTDTVDCFRPPGKRTRTGAAFYKARVWCPAYL